MIDDTGPRITALERRVAALEREAVLDLIGDQSCWCCVDLNGNPWTPARTRAEAAKGSTYIPSDRIVLYIPAPPPKRRKPRRKGYRAGGMS